MKKHLIEVGRERGGVAQVAGRMAKVALNDQALVEGKEVDGKDAMIGLVSAEGMNHVTGAVAVPGVVPVIGGRKLENCRYWHRYYH